MSHMSSLNVNMPEELRRYVDRRAKEGGFGTPTEYVRHLVREDQKHEAARQLEAKLLQALESGDFEEAGPEMFKRLRSRISAVQKKAKRTKRKGS